MNVANSCNLTGVLKILYVCYSLLFIPDISSHSQAAAALQIFKCSASRCCVASSYISIAELNKNSGCHGLLAKI